jgi:chloramphenicol-sensitive protein RarD
MIIPDHNKGLAAGLFCFIFWGVAPIYFKLIDSVPSIVIIAHRIIWGSLFLVLFLMIREKKDFFQSLKVSKKQLAILLISGLLVASNWLMFVWAVTHDQILATSLGYFINPLVNILLGVLFLHERLNKIQLIAVTIAAASTLFLGIYIGQPPWISLFLAFTFGLYGLVKKQINVRPMIGLFWETMLLILPASIYLLLYAPEYTSQHTNQTLALFLFFSGLVTVLPLIGFNYAAKRLSLTLIGFLQYIAPTMSFLIAVIFYGEVFTFGYKVAFTGIWLALIIISGQSLRDSNKRKKITWD